MTSTTETEICKALRPDRRWAFALQAACWVAGIAAGLTMVVVIILATFAQLDAFQ